MEKTTKMVSFTDAMSEVKAILVNGNGTAKVTDLKKNATIRRFFMLKSKMTVSEIVNTLSNSAFASLFTFKKQGRSVEFALNMTVELQKNKIEVVAEPEITVNDVRAFRAAFDKLDKTGFMVVKCDDLHAELGWSKEKFDEAIRQFFKGGFIELDVVNENDWCVTACGRVAA